MRTTQFFSATRSKLGAWDGRFFQEIQFNLTVLMLLIGSLLSAFAVVYLKDLNRRLFIQFQSEQQVRQQYEIEWGKLLLEQSTWSTQTRIQYIAQRQLNMVYPQQKNIVIVKLSKNMKKTR